MSAALELAPIPDEVEADRELAKRGLIWFLRSAWEQVDTDPLKIGWHNELVCDVLEAVSAGEIRDLVINIPPGFTKSLTAAVFWPTWEWATVDPALRYIFATYADSLTKRDAARQKLLMDSPWFRARWPDLHLPQDRSRSVKTLENSYGGVRFSTSIKGGVTGRHAHRIIVDDPTKPMDTLGSRAALGTELDLVETWWDQTMSTRQADPKRTARIVIMQRLHTRDLAAKVITETPSVVHVNLPMEYEPETSCFVRWERDQPDGSRIEVTREDPRTVEGELLCPERYDAGDVAALKRRLGSLGAAAQLQQRPTPAGGAVFKRPWFQYWGAPGCKFVELPTPRREFQIWDMSFKGAPRGAAKRSYVCGQAWATSGADMILVDQERGQWGFVEQQKAIARLTGRRPKAFRKYIEDAANGPAIVDAMRGAMPGMKLVSTGGGSEARAEAASVHFESGNVYFPHPSIAPWVREMEDELLGFPMGRHDDMVDCVSHAIVLSAERAHASYARAMGNLKTGGGL